MLQEGWEGDAVPPNHSGCPVPTMNRSPGRAQPVSSPFHPAQDGWGQAGDTPESCTLPGRALHLLEPSERRAQAVPSDVPEKGRHQCHSHCPRAPPGRPDGGDTSPQGWPGEVAAGVSQGLAAAH